MNYVWAQERPPILPDVTDYQILVVEASVTLIYDIRRSKDVTDILVSLSSLYRAVTGRSAIGSSLELFNKLAETLRPHLPGYFQSKSDWVDVLEDFHKNLHRVRDSTLGTKVISVINHTVAHTLYHKMGIEVDGKLYHQIEKGYIKANVWNVASFADALLGLFLFVVRAGRQAMLTGSADPFFVDSAVISDWLLKASKLRKDAEFLGNPSAVGIDTPTYLVEIQEAITEGEHLAKVFKDTQRALIQSINLELTLVQKRYQSTMLAASFRFCPFGIFLFGSSGVGKSFINQALFYHYCSVRGVPKERAFLYCRNSDDKYMSGYKSNMLGILIDDVGKHKPSKVMGIDQSLAEIISIGNNTATITNQAELHDKGKIPILSEWLGVTSNIDDLGVKYYYQNVYAVLRRVEWRITPVVKPDFCIPGTVRLDSNKVPKGSLYPDCWRFEINKAVRTGDERSLSGDYSGPTVFIDNFVDLLKWITPLYEAHIKQQTELLQTLNALGPEELCECHLPVSVCCCGKDDTRYIFGEENLNPFVPPVAQTASPASARMASAILVQRTLFEKFGELENTDGLFFRKYMAYDYASFIVDYTNGTSELSPADMETEFTDSLESFQRMPMREKLKLIANRFAHDIATDDYLTFTPKKGGKRNLIRDQLKWVHNYVLQYTKYVNWNKSQLTALEVYVYDKVPGYLAEGWDDDSLLQGAYDFVDKNAKFMQQASETQEFLDTYQAPQPGFREKVIRFFSIRYFRSPSLKRIVDYSITSRPGQFLLSRFDRGLAFHSRVLIAFGDAYDATLGGEHFVVKSIFVLCTTAAFGIAIAYIMKKYSVKGQFSVHSAGRKPIPREAEKKNVWKVEERNITKLNFHPAKPNALRQMMPAIERNSVRAEIVHNGLKGDTNVLVLDGAHILVNYHAIYENFTMIIHYGKNLLEGPQPRFSICVEPSMIRVVEGKDLAIITTRGLPALFKDIRPFFVTESCTLSGPGTYFIPRLREDPTIISVSGPRPIPFTGFQGQRGRISTRAYIGLPSEETVSGDCGSPLVIETPRGPVIAGIHTAFDGRYTYAVEVTARDLELSSTPMVQVGEVVPGVPLSQGRLTPDTKLYTDYHRDGQIIVFGAFEGFRARPKASGGYTEIAHYLFEFGGDFGHSISDRLTTPEMSGWVPQQTALAEYLFPTHSMSESAVGECVTSLTKHVINGLRDEDISDIHVVPLSVAVNGYPGVPNVDAQKFNTAAGHGFPGPKKKYIDIDCTLLEWQRYRGYNPQVSAEIEKCYSLALSGTRMHAIFTAAMKDEMVSWAKKLAGKTRVFYMCPVAYLTCMRVFTLGLTRVMVRRRSLFCIAVGLNTHSEEWDDMFQESLEIPGDNWMAGDFKGFDKILSILLQNGAKEVLLLIVKHCGFTDSEVLAFDTLLSDSITPCVDYFGTFVMFLGGEVSGHQLTTFFNCLCNIILHQYVWVVLCRELKISRSADDFFKYVFIRVLGDDIIAKVHPDTPWYNHSSAQRVFASIGITYTMADKTSGTVPYISYEDVSFLKRQFADHDSFPGVKVGALDKDSIYKMLTYTIASREVCPAEQLAQSICSAYSEAFYHGKGFYDDLVSIVEEAPKSEELTQRMLQYPPPTWQQCYQRFIDASPKFQGTLERPGCITEATPALKDSYCPPREPYAQVRGRVDPWGMTTMGDDPEERRVADLRLSVTLRNTQGRVEKNCPVKILCLTENKTITKNAHAIGEMTSACVKKVIKKHNKKQKSHWPCAQSNTQPISFSAESKEGEGVELRSKTPSDVKPMTIPMDLGSYLSRPRLIHTVNWLEAGSTGILAEIEPWSLLLNHISYREKMQGFNLFRATLKLKFTINGSPFYYGAMAAVYSPLTNIVAGDIGRNDTVGAGVNNMLVLNSQKPLVWLLPQEISETTMTLPFLYPYPLALCLEKDYARLGKLGFVIYRTLQSANGVSGSAVDIQLYAWLEDVVLTGPTNLPVGQSRSEYATGPISSVASSVAFATGQLSSVPIIGDLAMATSEVASGVGAVASALGFTNVPVIDNVTPVQQKVFELASTELSTPLNKLSLQPKQEIALGSSQHGGGVIDELNIAHFAQRKSFLVGSDWLTSQVPGDILFTSFVTPTLFQSSAGAEVGHTPMSFLSQMFQYWRGGIKFSVKVIRSKYHRGRLILSWDQGAKSLANGAAFGNLNTLSAVIDLDEADDYEFVIPYIQMEPFLRTYEVTGTMAVPWNTSSAPTGVPAVPVNGVFNIRVANRLTAPEASSSVALLISVSACDDIEFAAPRNLFPLNGTSFQTLSPLNTAVAQSRSVSTSTLEAESDPSVYHRVFGERVTSLREYLHRSSLAKSYPFDCRTDGWMRLTVPFKRMPCSPGFFMNGVDFTSAPVGGVCNVCPQHPIPLVTSCFIGYKGSVNVTANLKTGNDLPNSGISDSFAIDRVSDAYTLNAAARRPYKTTISSSGAGSLNLLLLNQVRSGVSGKALTNTRTMSGITANLPFYSNSEFYLSDTSITYNNGDPFTDANSDWWEVSAHYNTKTATFANNTSIDLYYGTGPDFDCVFFINVPLIYGRAYTLL